MWLTDFEKLTGKVVITSKDLAGNVEILVEDHNLIVLNGRNLLANSLVNGNSNIINTIAFGTGGTVSGSPSQVLAVQPTDTSVAAPINNLVINTDFMLSIDSSAVNPTSLSSSETPQLVYNILIPEITALNGQGINEIALMLNTTPTPTAFSIKKFATITKSSSISVSISWTLFF